jgi:hypothetical protein
VVLTEPLHCAPEVGGMLAFTASLPLPFADTHHFASGLLSPNAQANTVVEKIACLSRGNKTPALRPGSCIQDEWVQSDGTRKSPSLRTATFTDMPR